MGVIAFCHSYSPLYRLSCFTIAWMSTNNFILPLSWDFGFRSYLNDLVVVEILSLFSQRENIALSHLNKTSEGGSWRYLVFFSVILTLGS